MGVATAWGPSDEGASGGSKGPGILPAFSKSSTRSVMNHSERWLLAGSRASGGSANQDNPVYRSRFHSPGPFSAATPPRRPILAPPSRPARGRTKARRLWIKCRPDRTRRSRVRSTQEIRRFSTGSWGSGAFRRPPMDRMGWPLPADPGAPEGPARSDRSIAEVAGNLCRLMPASVAISAARRNRASTLAPRIFLASPAWCASPPAPTPPPRTGRPRCMPWPKP